MDYHQQPLAFKIKKALRYLWLYGATRTLIKIQGQYHMRRRFAQLPSTQGEEAVGQHVGLLGCGNYAFSNIAYYLRKNYGRVIRGVMDVDEHHAASLFREFRVGFYTQDADKILNDPDVEKINISMKEIVTVCCRLCSEI